MNNKRNETLTERSQELRRTMTKEEKHLWYDFLKKIPYTVNRQKVIGHYIVDFYIAEAQLVIELDGAQHYESENKRYDQERDAYMEKNGIGVLRYSNYFFHRNFESVCTDILLQIEKRTGKPTFNQNSTITSEDMP